MKLIVCGGRAFDDVLAFGSYMGIWCIKHGRPEEVVTGGASGADELGKRWAQHLSIPHVEFSALWAKEGRAAGPRRNTRMAAYAADGGCIAFPGGRGTADMVRQARAAGLIVMEVQP